jgi:hypothetical protein
LARQVVLLSGDDRIIAADDGRVLSLSKGQYGGWLLREKDAPEALHGLWCFKTSKKKASQKELEAVKEVLERMKKVAESLGIRTEPRVVKIAFKYRVVVAKREKATDRYSVYEITPTNEEAAAAAVRIEFPYKVGKYGRCANDVCRHYGKLKKLIEAEFRGGGALVSGASIVVPLDASELARAVAKLLGVDAEEAEGEEKAEEVGSGREAEEAEGGGEAGRRYLVALLPGGVDEEAAADAVREALRRLGVKSPVVKVVDAEI